MTVEVRLPQMSMGMQEATIVAWLKDVGDVVREGDELVEVEAEKSDFIIESPGSGVITEILVAEGDEVAVLSVLAIIASDANVSTGPGVQAPPDQPAPGSVAAHVSGPRRVALRGIRATVARRMAESLRTAAQLTLTTDADVTDLLSARATTLSADDATFTDLVHVAVVRALALHPLLNAHLVDDHLEYHDAVHLGVAVAVDGGLLVPVVRDAQSLDLAGFVSARRRAVGAIHAGGYPVELVSGSTFTVTNLGPSDIDAFTPILNPPEVAILGVGRIVERAARVDGELAWRRVVVLSLTFDHRALDGEPAAAFLRTLVGHLTDPTKLAGRRGTE